MKKLITFSLSLFSFINILIAKTSLEYLQSKSHFDITASHSFHTNLKITSVSGPLRLYSNVMPSFGFAVKYNYYLHKNIYCIIGFAFENIPTQFHWDFGTYKNYFPEKFKDYGFEKNQKNSHFFLIDLFLLALEPHS